MAVAPKMEVLLLAERNMVTEVPAGLHEVKALVTSSEVQRVLNGKPCHSRYTGGVHLTRKMKW